MEIAICEGDPGSAILNFDATNQHDSIIMGGPGRETPPHIYRNGAVHDVIAEARLFGRCHSQISALASSRPDLTFADKEEIHMHCANPACRLKSEDLHDGVLRLIELDVAPEDRILGAEGGFPICSVPTRYFWLCEECSRVLTIKRWTSTGLIFEPREDTNATPSLHAHGSRKPIVRAELRFAWSNQARVIGTN
jgi:hypothetical protein